MKTNIKKTVAFAAISTVAAFSFATVIPTQAKADVWDDIKAEVDSIEKQPDKPMTIAERIDKEIADAPKLPVVGTNYTVSKLKDTHVGTPQNVKVNGGEVKYLAETIDLGGFGGKFNELYRTWDLYKNTEDFKRTKAARDNSLAIQKASGTYLQPTVVKTEVPTKILRVGYDKVITDITGSLSDPLRFVKYSVAKSTKIANNYEVPTYVEPMISAKDYKALTGVGFEFDGQNQVLHTKIDESAYTRLPIYQTYKNSGDEYLNNTYGEDWGALFLGSTLQQNKPNFMLSNDPYLNNGGMGVFSYVDNGKSYIEISGVLRAQKYVPMYDEINKILWVIETDNRGNFAGRNNTMLDPLPGVSVQPWSSLDQAVVKYYRTTPGLKVTSSDGTLTDFIYSFMPASSMLDSNGVNYGHTVDEFYKLKV